jgi:YHS domain-containing protein
MADAQSSSIFSTKNGAIDGYDAVAFFVESKPVKGKPEFRYEWNGAEWYFSSKKNLDSFSTSPMKYAPQFGGYCAFGMSDGEGHKAPTQANTFSIVNGKLYLNYNLHVKDLWKKNMDSNIVRANNNWQRFK